MNEYVGEIPCGRYGVFTPSEIFVGPGLVERVQAEGPSFAPHAASPQRGIDHELLRVGIHPIAEDRPIA